MAGLLSWHRAGQPVVCIDAGTLNAHGRDWSRVASSPLVEGETYTITVAEAFGDLVGLQVAEVACPSDPDHRPFWRSTRFRPADGTAAKRSGTVPDPSSERVRADDRVLADA